MDETMNNCTHDCSTCGTACDDSMPKGKDIFNRLDNLSEALHDDAGFEMLEKLSAELDALEEQDKQ